MTNSPFHDPQQTPLPDANSIEKEASHYEASQHIELYSLQQAINTQGPSEHIKKDIKRLRNALIWLLVIGATLGGILGIGAAILLKHYGLLDPPQPNRSSLYQQTESFSQTESYR